MIIYDRYDIVFQELPGEVALAFTLKNCPNMCKGCHSEHLREKTGKKLTFDVFNSIINKYKGQATAILFLGGDSNHDDIISLMKHAKDSGFKTGVYSGLDEFKFSLMDVLDYYKAGGYIERLGGLNNETTNQRLIRIVDGNIENITSMFWR